jgi:uncharacterized protein YcbK (DUF882 family)
VQYKNTKIETEWNRLITENPKLGNIVETLNAFTNIEFGKQVVLTHIFRTPEEQKALYAQTPNPPATSPHMRWEAVDIRSTSFNDKEIQKMLTFLNLFTVYGGQRKCAIYHEIAGNTWHFHVQCGK